METYNKVWRAFFAVSLIAIAVQQFIYTGFRPVIMPPEPAFIEQSTFCMCVVSILLILISIAIMAGINSHVVADYLGASLLLMLVLFHIPYNIKTNLSNLGGWTNALKMLAFCGGALIVATSLPTHKISGIDIVTEKLRPAGPYFFATTVIVFGIMHFVYPTFVATLVPAWLPFHLFWTYFAGVALIAAGAAIVLRVKVKLAATLLGVALLLWLFMLHVPRAIADPHSGDGNEWTSVFEALGFSGIAFLIAGMYKPRRPETGQ